MFTKSWKIKKVRSSSTQKRKTFPEIRRADRNALVKVLHAAHKTSTLFGVPFPTPHLKGAGLSSSGREPRAVFEGCTKGTPQGTEATSANLWGKACLGLQRGPQAKQAFLHLFLLPPPLNAEIHSQLPLPIQDLDERNGTEAGTDFLGTRFASVLRTFYILWCTPEFAMSN